MFLHHLPTTLARVSRAAILRPSAMPNHRKIPLAPFFSSPRKLEPMRGNDAFFLLMERPDHLHNVVYALTFKRPQEMPLVLEDLRTLTSIYPRLRQIPHGGNARNNSEWIDDPDFDINSHVHYRTLPGSATTTLQHVQDYAADLMVRPFPLTRPLWDLHIIQGTGSGMKGSQDAAKGSTVIIRTHHALGDAQAFLLAFNRLSSLSTFSPAAISTPTSNPIPNTTPPKPTPEALPQIPILPHASMISQSIAPYPAAIAANMASTALGFYATFKSLLDVSRFERKSLQYPKERSTTKDISWSDVCSLEDIKALRKIRPGSTVNDILLTALTLTMRRILIRRGDFQDRELALLIPVSYRPPGDITLGNFVAFEFVFPSLEEPDSDSLLAQVRRKTALLKASWIPPLVQWAHRHIHTRPFLFNYRVAGGFLDRGHAIFSNVPGPKDIIYFAGQPIQQINAITAQLRKGSFCIAMLSYAGTINISIIGDKTPAQDGFAREICTGIAEEIRRMGLEDDMVAKISLEEAAMTGPNNLY